MLTTRLNSNSPISILSNTRSLHSTTKPTVPINPPKDKTSGTSTFEDQVKEQPPVGQHPPDSTSTPAPGESHPDASTSDVRQDQDHSSTVKHSAAPATTGASDSEVGRIEHLADPSTSEEIIHAERLGLKPADILREAAEKKEAKLGKRSFHTSARSLTSESNSISKDGEEKRLKGGSEGVRVGEGNVGKDGGEGKKEEDRSVSDESRIGEDTLGKVGGDKFGGGSGGGGAGAQIGSRKFSTSAFRRIEGQTGSKGTAKGKDKGEGLEHLKENTPSESEEAVHADKHGKNPLDELDDSKKAASPPKKE